MREDLLQFIWRFRYFNQSHLFTEAGEDLQILFPGEWNTGQGPDFRNARIRINGELREGPVELHVRASDWKKHGHATDANYGTVILHVVWENDDGPDNIPVLVLQHRVPKLLMGQYDQWMKSPLFIPCAAQVMLVDEGVWSGWKELLLHRRLHQRAQLIRDWLEGNIQDWEAVTWWLMARSMGLPVNGDAFEAIARSIPIRLLGRYRMEPIRIKALLLGQAGLFGEDRGPVQREYRFLRAKHGLSPIAEPVLFGRIRPAHFPATRLLQLAELFADGTGWFARIKEADSPQELEGALAVKGLGAVMKNGLLINAFVPLLYAYGGLRGERAHQQKALRWLREAKPEQNTLTGHWQRLGLRVTTAADSQSLLELKKKYCDTRKCLDCAVGQALLGL
jgi:hypothetical protein